MLFRSPFTSSRIRSATFAIASFISSSGIKSSNSLSFNRILSIFRLIFEGTKVQLFRVSTKVDFHFLLSVKILPSIIRISLPAIRAFSSEWVTITTVVPSRFSSINRFITSLPLTESRFPVGIAGDNRKARMSTHPQSRDKSGKLPSSPTQTLAY